MKFPVLIHKQEWYFFGCRQPFRVVYEEQKLHAWILLEALIVRSLGANLDYKLLYTFKWTIEVDYDLWQVTLTRCSNNIYMSQIRIDHTLYINIYIPYTVTQRYCTSLVLKIIVDTLITKPKPERSALLTDKWWKILKYDLVAHLLPFRSRWIKVICIE